MISIANFYNSFLKRKCDTLLGKPLAAEKNLEESTEAEMDAEMEAEAALKTLKEIIGG